MTDTSIPYVLMAVQPLADLLADSALTEIMVVGEQGVWVERQGVGMEKTPLRLNRLQIDGIVAHLAHLSHREADLQGVGGHAIISARLPGFRVEAQMPPVAVDGPYLSFRRHHPRAMALEDAVAEGDLPSDVATFLQAAVRARSNVLVVGGTGSGKTTLLNALIREVDRDDVLILIETVPELRVEHENVRRLEADDEQGYTVQRLVKSALRSRPDRILIGEVRGGEAFDFMDAANTGHPGAMGSLHANSALEGLQRFENLVLEGRPHMPLDAIRQRIGGTFDLLVHMERAHVLGRPRRRVREVVRLDGYEATRARYLTRTIHSATDASPPPSKATS
ncbi:MAG TPA: ATPase, T2SS/T4P/T4SS family [Burkholderiaceae bacterium]|nr:ATPase, T2SS/T4P/T4SS family [Burkholderiaceae bacterium]